MRLTEIVYPAGTPIDGYGPGFFRIGGVLIRGAALVLPGGAAPWAGLPDAAPFLAAAGEIDVLFVGTGAEIAQVAPAFRRALEAAGVGVEVMNSPAAARTYNVCLAEGRRVAAALMPV